jgi:glyoxylase-like metal-dependent hydrolase (beta-lactamase superfamily II)
MVDDMEQLNPAFKFAPPGGVRYTYVKNGEVLRVGGYSLRCISTPGHSPGHMCLWDEESGVMFTGDHVLFDITPNITAWPTIEDSLGDYLDSLRKVRDYPVKTALPGHRKQGDFHARIDELIGHHEVRLAEVKRIVRAEPGLTAFEIAGRMRWKIRSNNWDDFPAPQKIFAVGECQSHLDYLRLRGKINRELDGNAYAYI